MPSKKLINVLVTEALHTAQSSQMNFQVGAILLLTNGQYLKGI